MPVSRNGERLTVVEFCKEQKISRSTFYDWLAKRKAPRVYKIPNGQLRIKRSDIELWENSCEIAA